MLSRLRRDLEYALLILLCIPRSDWHLPCNSLHRVWHYAPFGKPLILGLRLLVILLAVTYLSPGPGFLENVAAGIPVGMVWGLVEKVMRG
jgi:hypothetical protein